MPIPNQNLRGIVVAGDTRQEAEEHYRAVATGLNVKALEDEDSSFVILSNADSELDLMNPETGDMSLVASDHDTNSFEFLASDPADVVSVFYTLCSTGCGSHIIADDSELMNHCPVCASELEDLDAEAIAEYEESQATSNEEEFDSESEDDGESTTSMITVASSKEEAIEAYRALSCGEIEKAAYDCETGIVVTASDDAFDYSPFTGEAASLTEDEVDFTVEASGEESTVEAHYYVCASSECSSHVIASDEDPVFCPVCASGLIEPEALAADDEEDDLDEDEEDDLDDGLDEEDDDLDDDDEDFDGDNAMSVSSVRVENDPSVTAGDDDDDEDDEDDDDEDDLDDDLDDDDLDDEDDDEEDDDDDEEANASARQELDSISTNLLSLASAEHGDLNADLLEAVYAGNIANTPTWIAAYDGKIVATATAESVTVDDAVFNSDTFGKLLHASAKEQGVEAALSELGWLPVEASVDVDAFVQQELDSRVEASVQAVRDNFEQSSKEYASRFEAALATAAVGVNKNFFEDVTNPVKQALASSLSSLGIQNADKLIAQAFAKHNDDYLKGLVAKACEIMEYDVSVQNQLTKAVASAANERAVATAGNQSISIGRPVETAEPAQPAAHEATASSTSPSLDAVLSTLGRRSR